MTITETAKWTGVHITRDEAIACAAGLGLLVSTATDGDNRYGIEVVRKAADNPTIDVHDIGYNAYSLLADLDDSGTWISDDIDDADQVPTTQTMAGMLAVAADLLAAFSIVNDDQATLVYGVVGRLHNWIDGEDDDESEPIYDITVIAPEGDPLHDLMEELFANGCPCGRPDCGA